ncbi:retrovirus-related pol polyprotein from transposon TNT 1-94 [Tanacetum coccineum]
MQGTSLKKQERECKLYDAFDKFAYIKGESFHQYYLRFTQLINDINIYKMKLEQFQVNTKFLNSLPPEWRDDPIDAINKMMSFLSTVVTSCFLTSNNQLRNSSNPRQQETIHNGRVTVQPVQRRQSLFSAGTSGTRANISGTRRNNSGQQRVMKCFNFQREGHMARQCPKPKRKRDATWFRDKVLLVEAQGSGKVLNEEELEFLADPGVAEGPVTQTVIIYNSTYQEDDLDAYDSDCNDFSTAKAVLMANLSSYESYVLSKNSTVNMNTSVNVHSSVAMNDYVNYVENCNKCLELKAELIKQHNMNNTSVNQTKPTFDHLFDLKNLKAELQAKDTTIEKLKANIKCLNKTSTTNNVKKDIDEIETINIELEHRVAKLIAKNKHLKQTYKQLYDSIKPSRKGFCHNNIKNDLRNFKGKDIVDNAAQVSNATIIAPVLYKLDPVTLDPKDKNNRETHIYYLQHTMEQAAILREIVEQAKSLNPLDSASYSACKYVKLIQELLGYVRDTCPDIHKPSEKLVTITPINKKKTLRSKSTNNTKNDRIPKISSSTQKKNKVEDHSRIIKSCLIKPNYVVEPSGNAHVQHSKLNINSELMCVKCNSFMFDARHELCFLEFVSDMNASSKSKSVKKAKMKE